MTIELAENSNLVERNQPTGITLNESNPILPMIRAVTEKGITLENAAALEKLTDLCIKMEAMGAKKAFAKSMAELQAKLPRVLATRIIPSKDGSSRSKFAAYEDIMAIIAEPLREHGFSISFSMKAADGRMCAICKLTHIDGHFEINEFAVRVGQGPPRASEAQSDGAARSYARRGALCDALNIVVDKDNDGQDARKLGELIDPRIAAEMQKRLRALGRDEKKFLEFAQVKSFEEIRVGQWKMLNDLILKAERSKPTNSAGARADTSRSAPVANQAPAQTLSNPQAEVEADDFVTANNVKVLRDWLVKMRDIAPNNLKTALTVAQIGEPEKADSDGIKRAARHLKFILLCQEGK